MGDIRVGGRNNVVLAGRDDKPAMMLANGFGCDQSMWRLIVPGLAEDYRVVLFDHVGSGGSELSAWRADRYATLDGSGTSVMTAASAPRSSGCSPLTAKASAWPWPGVVMLPR